MPPSACTIKSFRSVAPGAGERAGFVSEQLGIDQAFRHRRTIQRDIIIAGAAARLMDCTRENIFAAAGLAMKQDRRFRSPILIKRFTPLISTGSLPASLCIQRTGLPNLTTLGRSDPRRPGADWRRNPGPVPTGNCRRRVAAREFSPVIEWSQSSNWMRRDTSMPASINASVNPRIERPVGMRRQPDGRRHRRSARRPRHPARSRSSTFRKCRRKYRVLDSSSGLHGDSKRELMCSAVEIAAARANVHGASQLTAMIEQRRHATSEQAPLLAEVLVTMHQDRLLSRGRSRPRSFPHRPPRNSSPCRSSSRETFSHTSPPREDD